MILVFSQSPVCFDFLNKIFSVVTEEVMCNKAIAHHFHFTSNMKKKPQKKQV